MIKLVNILQEIQIYGRVTPQMVINLVEKFQKESRSSEIVKVFTKHDAYMHDLASIGWRAWINILSPKQLNSLYSDLRKLPLNEIQAVPAGRLRLITSNINNYAYGDQIYHMEEKYQDEKWGLKDNTLFSFWFSPGDSDIYFIEDYIRQKRIPVTIENGEGNFKRIRVDKANKYFIIR